MQNVAISNALEKLGASHLFGIGVINTVDAGGFQDDVGLDFHGAQGAGSVGGKIRIAGTGGENDHATFFEVANGAAANERFGNLLHGDGAEDASEDAGFLEGILQGEGVDDRGQHAHVVAGGAIDFEAFLTGTAEDIAAANHDGDFHAQFVNLFYLVGDFADGVAVDAEALRALEGFAGKFYQDALVDGLAVFCELG